jgi:hypothetical protein
MQLQLLDIPVKKKRTRTRKPKVICPCGRKVTKAHQISTCTWRMELPFECQPIRQLLESLSTGGQS